MKSLIVGMNIGKLYQAVLTELNHEIVTVDTNGLHDYTNVLDAIKAHGKFDTVHICTPNFTHEFIARQVANAAKIVFIEKPGVASPQALQNLTNDYPDTRFMMVKNNQWRDNIDELRRWATLASKVKISWINENRIPNPGSWFTTKHQAYGGVSRDLMPHLLSLYIAMTNDYESNQATKQHSEHRHSLATIDSTDYGVVNKGGTYDVDDYCEFSFEDFSCKWELVADWKSNSQEDRSIVFEFSGNEQQRVELGLCPESAYKNMIVAAIDNIDNAEWWKKQYNIDMWIHRMIATV